jgi:hypothetical protein
MRAHVRRMRRTLTLRMGRADTPEYSIVCSAKLCSWVSSRMSAFIGRADTAEYSIVCSATLEIHSQKLVTEYMYYRKSLYRGLLRTFEIRGNHGEVNVFQKFSKVLNTLTLYSRYTRALPFEEHLIIMERKRISKVLKSPESSKVHKSPQFSVVDILGH